MILELYQIPHLLLNSSTYLGNLNTPVNMELNVDLNNLRNIKLLLPSEYSNYNYVKVIDDNNFYYYILDDYKYHNKQQVNLTYRLDVIRTIYEHEVDDLDVRLTKFSQPLKLNPNAESYFWKNQDMKLSADMISHLDDVELKLHPNLEVNKLLNKIKWVYIWLQPKQTLIDDATKLAYQYKLHESFTESIIEVNSADMPTFDSRPGVETYESTDNSGTPGRPPYLYDGWNKPWWNQYIVGQVYYVKDRNHYVRYSETSNGWPGKYQSRRFNITSDLTSKNNYIFINDLKGVSNQDLPNSAYCIVLPTIDINVNFKSSSNTLNWNVNNILPNIMDVGSENTWITNIVDLKISNMPPIDFNNSSINLEVIGPDNLKITSKLENNLANLHGSIQTVRSDQTIDNSIYVPALTSKLVKPLECNTTFSLTNKINQKDLIYKKYYLSMFENRVELDIPLLINDGADKMFLYEDVQPGRSNVLIGYAPSNKTNMSVMNYLIHSPSTLAGDRDLSLPTFTSNYESYASSNKNFMMQAELSRNTQLQQGLINSGSQALGASAVSLSMEGYNPVNSLIKAAGGAANAIIAFNAQKKQFGWSIDNMKSAPGSYKNASATTSMILSLNKNNYWFETYSSNEFDISLYEDVISEIGYDYFDMRFKIQDVFEKIFQMSSSKRGFIQGRLVGVSFKSSKLNQLSYILNEALNEGVNIYL